MATEEPSNATRKRTRHPRRSAAPADQYLLRPTLAYKIRRSVDVRGALYGSARDNDGKGECSHPSSLIYITRHDVNKDSEQERIRMLLECWEGAQAVRGCAGLMRCFRSVRVMPNKRDATDHVSIPSPLSLTPMFCPEPYL